ncbi:MAG: GNAT family N-acetyltransferase [Faecalibacillus sp.]
MIIKELTLKNVKEITILFKQVFSQEPWNDNWNDEQLHLYLIDLMGNNNSLIFGLFEENQLIGLAIGHICHWYQGTEYRIDELCIDIKYQRKGLGTFFLHEIEKIVKEKKIETIFLQTERTMPAYHFYKKNGFVPIENLISLFKNIRENNE